MVGDSGKTEIADKFFTGNEVNVASIPKKQTDNFKMKKA
jgi:hypothetical protein